jgi:hypothetical protein
MGLLKLLHRQARPPVGHPPGGPGTQPQQGPADAQRETERAELGDPGEDVLPERDRRVPCCPGKRSGQQPLRHDIGHAEAQGRDGDNRDPPANGRGLPTVPHLSLSQGRDASVKHGGSSLAVA